MCDECLFQIDPNKEIQLDVSSTSSDSDTDYLTPLTGLRKEELLQKERELQSRMKRSKEKKREEKRSKRKRKKRYDILPMLSSLPFTQAMCCFAIKLRCSNLILI